MPVFTDRADVHETDFTEVWMHWFANDRTGFMEEEAVFALNEITTYLCVENASGIALSVTAELYATLYALACMQTKTTHPFFFFFFFFHGIGNTHLLPRYFPLELLQGNRCRHRLLTYTIETRYKIQKKIN